MNDSAFDAKNKVLNCDGKTVTLSSQDIVGAAVCNGKHVQYAAADSHGQLMLLTNDLANYQDAHDISSLNDWKGVKVSSAFPSSMSANFAVTGASSMVACDDYNFVFWRDQGGHFWALRCAPDGKSKPEVVSINLANTTLATSSPTSNMAAIKLPKTGNANLDGKIGVLALVSGPLSYVAAVVLDPSTFNKNQPWAASDHTGGLWCKFDQDPSIAATYTTLSASWLNQGILQLSGADKPQTYSNCVLQKYVELDIGSNSAHSPLLSTFYWGEVFSVPNYITSTVVDQYKNTQLVSMVADTESAINQKMQTLFNGLTPQQQQMFVINGQDYRSLYNGNYITNVVNRFGMNTFGPGRNASYLEFSFSETGVQRNEFQATTNFTDTGGWFVNGSFYAGLASHIEENGELGFLGIISFGVPMAEEETSFMVGVDFSGSMNTTQSDTKTWGIKLGEYLNPLAPGEAYTVRMYFLKPSPLWAMEVKQFGLPTSDYPPPGPDIDLINSSPVRVLFTVSYVSDALANRLRAS